MEDLKQRLEQAVARTRMVGWDFSRLDGRVELATPDWDFEALCLQALAGAEAVLDIGTGGGERLRALCQQLEPAHRHLAATEGWAPNVEVARQALADLDVQVEKHDPHAAQPLPWPPASFDVVMARHEAFDAHEVARVLRPGGQLLTQQVHAEDLPELHEWFGSQPSHPESTLQHSLAAAQAAGLQVQQFGQWSGPMCFADVQTLVEYLTLVSWASAGFTVEAHLDTLAALEATGPLTLTQRRYYLTARRAAA